jgi:hypothetical protein
VTRLATLLALALPLLVSCGRCERPAVEADDPRAPLEGVDVRAAGAATDLGPSTPQRFAPLPYSWTLEPDELMVLRDTPVELKVVVAGEAATCAWDFGDGDQAEGCSVRHVFRGGLADAWLSLTLKDSEGRERAHERRKIPLERLPVVSADADEPEEDLHLPAKPGHASARRVLFVGPVFDAERLTALVGAVKEGIRPDLVICTGDLVERFSEEAFTEWMRLFLTPLASSSVPVVVMPGERDLSTKLAREVFSSTLGQILFKPVLDYQDETGYPFWYSFVLGTTYFIIVDSAEGGLIDARYRWLKQELARAAAYPRTFVVSHLPPAPLTSTDPAALKRAYKIRELLLRYRGSVLFTGHHPVYYDGGFSEVRVVSTGGAVPEAPSLLGARIRQGPVAVVVDWVGNEPLRVFGAGGGGFDRLIRRESLPATVDKYVRTP